ncbi:hypothetical protein QYE76_063146 [Lolium multiflorum]|uniref:RNase H type-1 domain-containing protein n=1 Tax=Lolium multiflorum TaxID=4521 RepID=A0AAD8S5K6_LOLMU|nr:hypothetical protein QYE76_063146 [Lolium multiflorum]
MVRATSMSVTGPAEVIDDGDGYRTLRSNWACLGGSWCPGECVCERRERGEVSSDEACPWRVRARAGVTERRGHVLARAVSCSPWSMACNIRFRGVRLRTRTEHTPFCIAKVSVRSGGGCGLRRYEHLAQDEKEKDTRKPHWVPPAGDGIKININGSFLSETKSGGWDFVIRDAQGDSMGAAAGHIDSAHDALQTEAVAYMKAMEAAQQWGMVHVVLETDAQLLANAMNSDDDDLP